MIDDEGNLLLLVILIFLIFNSLYAVLYISNVKPQET